MRNSIMLAVAGLALASMAPAQAASLQVAPAEVLEGDALAIRVTGVKPGAHVTLHAQSVLVGATGEKRLFHAAAEFVADRTGVIDLSTAVPLSGDYQGADLRGLFWSQRLVMQTPDAQAAVARLGLPDAEAVEPDQVVLSLEEGATVTDRAVLTLRAGDTGVRREDVRAPGLVARYYVEGGSVRRPVIVLLGGSEGGLGFADWLGPLLASRGYAVLGLAYYAPNSAPIEGVPTAVDRIPVESLELARAWLAARPEADVERFGVVGASKGGEFTLVLASTYDWIDAAVAFTPSDTVDQGFRYGNGEEGMGSSWSRGGRELPYIPMTGMRAEVAKFRTPGARVGLAGVKRANLAAASPDALEAARIPLERSHAALLMFGGGDDQWGDSGSSVARAGERLKRQGFARPFEAVVYPAAGHLIVDTGWRPTTLHDTGPSNDGGTPEADARAQADAWAKMIVFLKRELGA